MPSAFDYQSLKSLATPGRHTDPLTPGLHLWVKPTLKKYWIYRYTIYGKRHNISLGVQDRRAALRAALEGKADELLAKAVEKALEGDTAVLIALLSKLIPRTRPEASVLENPISGSTLGEQATAIVSSVLSGDISPSIASELLQTLTHAVRVKEADELRMRIEALETKILVNT